MRVLSSSVEPSGSIVVFNASFEKSRMQECAAVLPQYAPWVMETTTPTSKQGPQCKWSLTPKTSSPKLLQHESGEI